MFWTQDLIDVGLSNELETLPNGPADLRTQDSQLWVNQGLLILNKVLAMRGIPNHVVIYIDGYTTDDITYLWKQTDPVQIAKGLNLPRFSIEKYSNSYCNVKTNTG